MKHIIHRKDDLALNAVRFVLGRIVIIREKTKQKIKISSDLLQMKIYIAGLGNQ